jgi:tetratricopeptide (TPR) repeat protein
VDARGVATSVKVTDVNARAADAVLERCIAGVVESLPYFAAGLPITMSHTLTVPEGRASRRTKCSGASKVALPLRKGIWSARGSWTAQGFVLAAHSCELPKWEDRRAFLLLALEAISDGSMRLAFASALEVEGESDAANYVRRETLRRVTSFEELSRLRDILMAGEPAVDAELDKAYAKATTDAQRLDVVLRFRELAPHNGLVRRRLFALLEVLGKREALVSEIAKVRAEPFADAGLLSQGASALRRVGLDAEGRRAFGELIERAPSDPWTLAYVGDRLRAEGMFDEAYAAYESLWRVLPGEASVSLRMALAHAGAGRLDAAARLLDRVTQTGGRGDDGRLGELAAITKVALLAGADPRDNVEARAELARRLLETPLPDVLGLVLVQSAPSDDPVEVRVQRERGEGELQSADLDARSLGLSAVRIERGDGKAKLNLIRKRELGPSRPARAVVLALSLDRERGLSSGGRWTCPPTANQSSSRSTEGVCCERTQPDPGARAFSTAAIPAAPAHSSGGPRGVSARFPSGPDTLGDGAVVLGVRNARLGVRGRRRARRGSGFAGAARRADRAREHGLRLGRRERPG